MRAVIAGLGMLLAGCSSQTLATGEAALASVPEGLQAACTGARLVAGLAQGALKGGALGEAQSYGAYVGSVCNSITALVTAAQDPSTEAWLQGIVAELNKLLAKG